MVPFMESGTELYVVIQLAMKDYVGMTSTYDTWWGE